MLCKTRASHPNTSRSSSLAWTPKRLLNFEQLRSTNNREYSSHDVIHVYYVLRWTNIAINDIIVIQLNHNARVVLHNAIAKNMFYEQISRRRLYEINVWKQKTSVRVYGYGFMRSKT